MFSNLQLRPAKLHRRKQSLASRSAVNKRRVSVVHPSLVENLPSVSFMESLFGAEFPEVFTSGDALATRSRKRLDDLPAELLAVICEHVSKMDVKRLRLVNRYLGENVALKIERAYISPNMANLEVLRQILDHSRYRMMVRELVYDAAQLVEYPTLDAFRQEIMAEEAKWKRDVEKRLEGVINGCGDEYGAYPALEADDMFEDGRLTELAKGLLLSLDDRAATDAIARDAQLMSVEQSYEVYKKLYQHEESIKKRKWDCMAFKDCMEGFPNLRKVTMTSEIWRPWNRLPKYDTPFFRRLPAGFRKPAVWPLQDERRSRALQATNGTHTHTLDEHSCLPPEWRAYTIVIEVLSSLFQSKPPQIEEFVIETANEHAGLPHLLFSAACHEAKHTFRVFKSLPIRHLRLSLVGPKPCFKDGLLGGTLLNLTHLQHLDFNPNLWRSSVEPNTWLLEWRHVFPTEVLARLKTLVLRYTYIDLGSLLELMQSLICATAITLHHVAWSLSHERHMWATFFDHMYRHYAENVEVSRPRFTLVWPTSGGDGGVGEETWSWVVRDELNAYLYEGAQCPLTFERARSVGWVVSDRDQEAWKWIYG